MSTEENQKKMIYCPVCQRNIDAENIEEVEGGIHDTYFFVHDPVPHTEEDMEALIHGLN